MMQLMVGGCLVTDLPHYYPSLCIVYGLGPVERNHKSCLLARVESGAAHLFVKTKAKQGFQHLHLSLESYLLSRDILSSVDLDAADVLSVQESGIVIKAGWQMHNGQYIFVNEDLHAVKMLERISAGEKEWWHS
jgi:hypothetical protein